MSEGPKIAILSCFSCNGCNYLTESTKISVVEYDGTLGEKTVYDCSHPNAAKNIQGRSDWLTPFGCPFNPYKRPAWELKLDYPTSDWK